MVNKPATGKTLLTQARIVATAEQLFAERGVGSVSLNEITRAAGQKNRNAVHYHFGSKQALLQAIFDKHAEAINRRRQALVDALEANTHYSLEDVIRALVLPVADKLDDADGGVAYIKISAQLTASSMLSWFNLNSPVQLQRTRWHQFAPMIEHRIDPLPRPVLDQRMTLMVGLMFHGMADHALFREQNPESGLANTALMVNNLVDSICAILRAPVSQETREILQ